jgi:hypothetical protein
MAEESSMPRKAKLYIGFTTAAGLGLLAGSLLFDWQFPDPVRYFSYLALALLCSALKIRLPKIQGTISINFLFFLIGVAQLSFAETLVLGGVSTVVQCVWKARKRPTLIQVLFNVAALSISISVAYPVAHALSRSGNLPALLVLGTCLLFLSNTALISMVLAFLGTQPFYSVWRQCYLWTFPYYLVGAAVASVIIVSGRSIGWKPSLLVLPVMYLVYSYYRLHLAQEPEEERVRAA